MAKHFSSLGILKETTGQKRHRLFAYTRYLALLGEPLRRKTKAAASPKQPRARIAARPHQRTSNQGPGTSHAIIGP